MLCCTWQPGIATNARVRPFHYSHFQYSFNNKILPYGDQYSPWSLQSREGGREQEREGRRERDEEREGGREIALLNGAIENQWQSFILFYGAECSIRELMVQSTL